MLLILALLLSYLLGAIPFSQLVARRVAGIDLRRHGSGNLGATNVFRTLGPGWGVLVLICDMGKGALAVLVVSLITNSWQPGAPTPLNITPDLWRILAGLAATMGHTFSPFVGFHGGKGVATTAGAFFVLAPYPLLCALAVFGAVVAATRIVSLASISAAAVLPIAVAFFEFRSVTFSDTIFYFTLGVSFWVIMKHRANIRRLRDGTEAQLSAGGGADKKEGTPDEGDDSR